MGERLFEAIQKEIREQIDENPGDPGPHADHERTHTGERGGVSGHA